MVFLLAFDTVNRDILCEKSMHYGFKVIGELLIKSLTKATD